MTRGARGNRPAHMSNVPPTPIMIRALGTSAAYRSIHRSCFGAPKATKTTLGCEDRIDSISVRPSSVEMAIPSSPILTPDPAASTERLGSSARQSAAARRPTSPVPPTNATGSPREAARRTAASATSMPGHRRIRRPVRRSCTSAIPAPSGSARSASSRSDPKSG
jgi:hypothetical protein